MAEGSPINDIMQMKQQGLSNNQIINNLQRSGYTNTQIFDAMNQADTKLAVEGIQPGMTDLVQNQPYPQSSSQMFTQPPELQQQPMQQAQPVQQETPVTNLGPETQSTDYGGYASTPSHYSNDQVQVEELVEAIIEEKWTELVKDVNKIVEWKNKIEEKISALQISLDHMKDSFSDLNKGVLGKVNEYDKHILEIGSDIKAMEKVFSKVLPAFTDNVNELSRITDKLKKGDKN